MVGVQRQEIWVTFSSTPQPSGNLHSQLDQTEFLAERQDRWQGNYSCTSGSGQIEGFRRWRHQCEFTTTGAVASRASASKKEFCQRSSFCRRAPWFSSVWTGNDRTKWQPQRLDSRQGHLVPRPGPKRQHLLGRIRKSTLMYNGCRLYWPRSSMDRIAAS